MTITFGQLKEYTSDQANNMADATAARVLARIVQDALLLLGRVHEWSFLRCSERIATSPPETKAAVVDVTQDSGDFVLSSGAWLSKHLTQKWVLTIDGTSNRPYTAASLEQTTNPNDTFRAEAGQAWIDASATGRSGTLYRPTYQLQNPLKRLYAARLLAPSQIELSVVERSTYEHLRRMLNSTASQPSELVVLSPLEVGLWPHPEQRYDVELEALRKVRVPAAADADSTAIDWPDAMQDLLRAAIRLQCVERWGDEGVPFDADLASRRFGNLLKGYKLEQGTRGQEVFPLSTGSGGVDRRRRVDRLRGPVS